MAADSHRTISKNSSGCRLLIGHKKCYVLLCPISERLGCYQQEQFNLPREHFVFDSSQCIVNNRKVKMWRRRESQISNSLTRQNNNFARAVHFFVHFFALNCTTTRENA